MPSSIRKVAIYARAYSSPEVGQQVRALRGLAADRGWETVGVHTDTGFPSAKRPEFERMAAAIKSGTVDVVLVTSLDRIAKSTIHLVMFIDALIARGVDLVAVEDDLDIAGGDLTVLNGILTLAAVEKSLRRERGRACIRDARIRGAQIGRPAASFELDEAMRLRAEGWSFRQIARRLGVGSSTVHRALAAEGL